MVTRTDTKLPWHARQGDVLLMSADIPADAVPQPRIGGRVVLAYGEVTGHAHVLLEPEVVEMKTPKGRRFITGRGVERHEEHSAIEVERPVRVIRQRQYDYASQLSLRVDD